MRRADISAFFMVSKSGNLKPSEALRACTVFSVYYQSIAGVTIYSIVKQRVSAVKNCHPHGVNVKKGVYALRTCRRRRSNGTLLHFISYFFLCYSDLCLLTDCRCRESLLLLITFSDTHTEPVGLLWTSDRPLAETATYTTHNRHNTRTSMLSAGFEPALPAS